MPASLEHWEATACLLIAALVVRASIGLFGYSGEHMPPMYGDFEAQRHWMEVTVNLAPTSWYVHGSDNDLQYWGLDYPPLSAHLSWLIGRLAQLMGCGELVALHTSRGLETSKTRAFMRNSVLALDALIFLPGAVAWSVSSARSARARLAALLQVTCVPALILVDHGHFQYNCVSLGLALWAILAALGGCPLLCACAFSLSLNFKQMSLYLAPAFFCYLLSGCLRRQSSALGRALAIARLGAVVVGTFALCWAPFLASSADMLAVLRRIFPVERHLYEDKVANLWCTLALLPPLKLKSLLPISTLLRLAMVTTLGALMPPCAILLARPSRTGFLLCAVACSLAFFLCSFQVHEPKLEMHRFDAAPCFQSLWMTLHLSTLPFPLGSYVTPRGYALLQKHILLPLLPASLLALHQPLAFGWFSSIACFSLYPLLKRDGLALPYAICQVGFLSLSYCIDSRQRSWRMPRFIHLLMGASLGGALLLHVLEATITPPARYPDLHSVAFAAYSCVHFSAMYFTTVVYQYVVSDAEAEHTPFDGLTIALRNGQSSWKRITYSHKKSN